jgi:hypothetical protein
LLAVRMVLFTVKRGERTAAGMVVMVANFSMEEVDGLHCVLEALI